MLPAVFIDMATTSSLQLAIDVSKILHQTTRLLLASVPWHPFCERLEDVLDQIMSRLKNVQNHEEDEIRELLMRLDALCQVVSFDKVSFEQKIAESFDADCATPQYTSNSGVSSAEYPALQHVLQDRDHAAEAFENFALRSPRSSQRMKLISDIEYLVSPSSEDEVEDIPTHADKHEVNILECGKELVILHGILSSYCPCPPSEKGASKMVAQFRLRNEEPENDEANVTFGILFMAHPHQHESGTGLQPCWQDTRICMRRTVRFVGSSNTSGVQIIPDSVDSFCTYISDQLHSGPSLLHFSIADKKLYFEQHSEPETRWIIDQPSVSLAELLERSPFATSDIRDEQKYNLEILAWEKRKGVLSWLLAKAVLQHYTSPWMLQPWTKENVHFLRERRSDSDGIANDILGIYVNEPLLSVTIAPTLLNEEQPSLRKRNFKGHKIPKLLGLGIMLIEIQLWRPIESLYAEDTGLKHCLNGKPHLNTNYKICEDLVSAKMFQDIKPLEQLIRHCIFPKDKFLPPNTGNEEGIQQALRGLVAELERYIHYIRPDKVKPLIFPLLSNSHVSSLPAPRQKERSPLPVFNYRCASPRLGGKKAVHRSGQTMAQTHHGSKDWFARMESLNYILQPDSNDSYAKVRIAVIDTGVKPDNSVAEYIAGYKDYVSNDNKKHDYSGHGTTSLELIFDMCGPADVYALRVFETDEATEETRGRAIQAIKWCIANQIDVLCMACGFRDYDQELSDIIKQASRKLLIFAAPTNSGNADGICYPARHDKDVFCMLSSTANIKVSQELNPTVEGSFAILGENITTLGGELKSGTSLATAIAAGLAGRLLDFARHDDCRGEIDDLMLRIRLKDGMSKVFEAMSTKPNSEGIRCLKPWEILPRAMRDKLPFGDMDIRSEDIPGAREEICQDICKQLREV